MQCNTDDCDQEEETDEREETNHKESSRGDICDEACGDNGKKKKVNFSKIFCESLWLGEYV